MLINRLGLGIISCQFRPGAKVCCIDSYRSSLADNYVCRLLDGVGPTQAIDICGFQS